MAEKKYFWLKLKDDFFKDKRIKKLRKIAGGDTYTIIYLKMQLLSLSTNGVLVYEKLEPSFAEEIALQIDEESDNIAITIEFLLNTGLLEELDENNFLMTETIKCIGKEGASAKRVREHREKIKALQCNDNLTKCNTEKEIEKELEIDVCICQRNKQFKDSTCKDCWHYKECKRPFYGVQPKQEINIETEDVETLKKFFAK